MPVTCIPSEEEGERQKSTAKKRRRNQNVEIDELSQLLPVARSYGTMMDKISTLRMTSAYLKLNTFLTSVMGNGSRTNGGRSFLQDYGQLLQQAQVIVSLYFWEEKATDGFFLILDAKANILYVSETISDHVDLAQQDVLGLSLHEITHEDDAKVIDENLQPNGPKTTQFRQFYIRFKSTLTPGRMQQSRFSGYKMVQMVGHLKLSKLEEGKMEVTGIMAECHLIESAPSILELSIPQTYFTSTLSLDLKIINVDTKVTKVTGFDPVNFIGADIADYFHPLDHVKMTPCRALLLRSGTGVSPVFRFMTSSGDWIWAQLEGLVRYKEGTLEPLYYEVKCKAVSHADGHLKFIEQTQLFASSDAKDYDDPESIHRDKYFVNRMPGDPVPSDPEQIVCGLMDTKMPPGVVDALLHTRELGLEDLEQRGFKRLLTEEKQGSHEHGSQGRRSHDRGSHDHSGSHGSPQTNECERAKSSCSVTSDYCSYPSPHSTSSVPLSAESPDSTYSSYQSPAYSSYLSPAYSSYQSPASVPFRSPPHTDVARVPETCNEFPEDYSNTHNPPAQLQRAPFHPGQKSSFHQPQNPSDYQRLPSHSYVPPVPYLSECTAVPDRPPSQMIGYMPLMSCGDYAPCDPGLGFTFRPLCVDHPFGAHKPFQCGQHTTHLELSGSVVQSSVVSGAQDELHDILEQFV